MKNREEFWDKTMEKLDEKLINQAAEEINSENEIEDEYVGARVEKIPVSTKRAIPFAPIIASAAAVCLIVGGVFLVRNMPIGVAKPSESSVTTDNSGISITTPTVTTTAVSTTETEDKGDIVGQVQWGADFEEDMRLDLYEYYFFGEWQDKDSEETFKLNYYEDFITSECSFIGFNETDTEVSMYFSTLDKKCTFIISKSNTNIMYTYATDISLDDDNIYQSDLVYTCYRLSAGTEEEKDIINSSKEESKELGYFGRVRLLQYLASKETVSRNYGKSALYALTSKTLYNEETGYYKSEFVKNQTDKQCFFMLYTRDENNLVLTVPYSPLYGGKTVNMSIEIALENGEWVITDIRGNDKKIYTVVNESEEVISAEKIQEIANQRGSFDFGLLERSFYGKWDRADNINDNPSLPITYNKDFFIRGYVNPSCIYEDENCYYLLYMGGGMGQLLLIDKSNPDIMYSYIDLEFMDTPRDIGAVYIRNQFVELNTDITNGCSVSILGLMKFKNDYGFDLSEEDSFNDESGNTWIHGDAYWGEGYGDIYLNENSGDRIVFSKRYYRDDLLQEATSEEEHHIPSDMSVYQYFRITAEKQGDSYAIVSREMYAEELLKDREKMSSEYLNLVDKETEQINNMIEEENLGDLSSTVIATSFYTDLSGKYYAIREAGNNMGQVMAYGELYYYNGEGNGYRLIDDGMCGNLKVYISGDRLFLFGVYRDDESEELYDPVFLNVYRDGEKIYSEEFGRSSPLTFTAREIGDFIALSYAYDMKSDDGEKIINNRNILVNKYDVNVNYVTVDDIAVDKADGVHNFNADYDTEKREFKGFTLNLDGEEYSYRVDGDSLEDCMYGLRWLYNDIYNSFYLGFEENEGSISVNGVIYNELKNFKSRDELTAYLGRVFTEKTVETILNESGMDFYSNDGKYYVNGNTGGKGREKRKVKLSVQSVDGNEAIINIGILSDSENDSELPALGTVKAVKTEKGWRLSEYIIDF